MSHPKPAGSSEPQPLEEPDCWADPEYQTEYREAQRQLDEKDRIDEEIARLNVDLKSSSFREREEIRGQIVRLASRRREIEQHIGLLQQEEDAFLEVALNAAPDYQVWHDALRVGRPIPLFHAVCYLIRRSTDRRAKEQPRSIAECWDRLELDNFDRIETAAVGDLMCGRLPGRKENDEWWVGPADFLIWAKATEEIVPPEMLSRPAPRSATTDEGKVPARNALWCALGNALTALYNEGASKVNADAVLARAKQAKPDTIVTIGNHSVIWKGADGLEHETKLKTIRNRIAELNRGRPTTT